MIASKSYLYARTPSMSINTAENDAQRVQRLDESDPCLERHGKKSVTGRITQNRSRRLTYMLILFLFCYMYVGDVGEKHGYHSKYENMKTKKTRIAPSYSKNGSLSKKIREKRSVTGREIDHVNPAPNSQENMNDADHSRCPLKVDEASIKKFYKLFSWNGKTMIYFRLNFSSAINVTVEPQLYLPFRWVWVTYGLDHSTRAMLEYPTDFNILSLGLLYMHVYRAPEGSKNEFVVNVDTKHHCPVSLQLGAKSTMKKIRDALRLLLNKTKDKNLHRKSLFCYENVINRTSHSQLWWYTTHMLTIAKDYTYYICCTVKGPCNWHVPQTYYMWLLHAWSLAIACFSPLLMHIIPDHKRRRITNDRWAIFETDSGEGCSSLIDVAREPPDFRQEKWIYLGENPTSIIPLIKKILCLHKSNRFFRRMWRIVLLLLSLSVLFTKVVVYYFKVREDVVEALRLNIPVGELCIPYGYQECLKTTEYFLGGPIVYIPLYIVIASILLCIPESIPNLFLNTKEFQNDANAPVITFLYITDGVLETRGIIRRQVITSGYACLAGKIKERFFMILSFAFWRSFFSMWSRRFKMVNLASIAYLRIGHPRSSRALVGAALFPTILAWVLLTGLCILEFITVLLYYGLPVVFFLKLAISGLMTLVLNAVSLRVDQENSSRLPYPSLVFGGIIGAVVLVATLFVTTVAIMNFVHTFMFLVNILSFTFAGLVVYPEYSATYSIAAIAILYYLFKSVSSFTEGYVRLLQKVVHVSDRLQRSTWRPYGYHAEEDEYRPCFVRKRKDIFVLGVPRACFDYVARMVKPLRIQVSIAFLKLLITANVIYSTVMLTQAFRHGANINLTTRTMAVIFVGLMPEVFGVFTSKVRRIVDEELYERKIETWVKAYWQEHLKLTSYEAVP